LFEVPEKEAEKFAKDIKTEMENVYKLSVPLIADVSIGDNWGET
jgi:DNA polymerase I-like protein with 3'-5' exonuclease and polymerase domains